MYRVSEEDATHGPLLEHPFSFNSTEEAETGSWPIFWPTWSGWSSGRNGVWCTTAVALSPGSGASAKHQGLSSLYLFSQALENNKYLK